MHVYLRLVPHVASRLTGLWPIARCRGFFSIEYLFFYAIELFDPTSERRPLLHTWSLGVEEQFYFVFPLVLIFLFRYGRSWVAKGIILTSAVSLLASAILVYRLPTAAFYLAPMRAWELLLGTMIAMKIVYLPESRLLRELAGACGILLILAATFGFHGGHHFPGLKALIPCVGAALIIVSGQLRDTLCYRLLSIKPVVFIGAISYSLYLWHWPLISLRSYNLYGRLHVGQNTANLLIFIGSLAAATLSWWLVEIPFRKGAGMTRRRVFFYAGTGRL